ncbi:hypothetical protein P3X46_017873 [Hevea brasiliensis]|uniref:HIT-type domain-containing protein n=1 Tax=Hevea brasiliensis TaxID=3981 RepID=A0ABQ9LP03_HEVBR|nr:uncharacterized protein LOC110637720 [Hevea brasiliensis]KAJ9169714.1 hypothetical protein P3X46_017873 [Hevea brasiliensis]
MGPKQCQVCNEAKSKYKCPSCLAPYCSLGCFKKHKETPCAKPVSAEEKSTADPELTVERSLKVDDASEVLLKPQLESIASSSEIRNALKDDNLRKLIHSIDCAPDPASELDKAMGVEEFRIFTEKILSAIGQ